MRERDGEELLPLGFELVPLHHLGQGAEDQILQFGILLVFMIGCMAPNHPTTEGLEKSLFSTPGSIRTTITVRQITDWADNNTTKLGVRYPGCIVSLSEALWHHLEDEEVNCYQCNVDTPVVLSQASPAT